MLGDATKILIVLLLSGCAHQMDPQSCRAWAEKQPNNETDFNARILWTDSLWRQCMGMDPRNARLEKQ